MSGGLFALTLGTALGCGLIAGVFFAFSSFVMPALGRLPAGQGIAAMQSINVRAVTPPFLLPFLGTALLCVAVSIIGVVRWSERFGPWMVAGGLMFLLGTFALTLGYHVPRNDALATVDPQAAEAAGRWDRYQREWNAWNHVRGAAALIAAALLTVALWEA